MWESMAISMGDAEGRKTVIRTRLIRINPQFFKGDTLLEIGFDNRERLDLHFIQRF